MGDPAKNAFDVKDFLAKVGVGKTVLKFQKNQTVFTQGDTAESVYYIQRLHERSPAADRDHHWHRKLRHHGNYKTGYEGHSSRPAGVFRVVRGVSSDPQQPDRRDLIDQLFNSSERRLARMLLLLAHFGKEGTSQPITPNISQETLAEMIGTTRSRVSQFMNKFRKLGLINYNGHIEVNSALLDAVLHDKPELKEDE
jgi:CRP/FNR family cyclic AMP-dependent transcriptional regulator